MARGQNPMSRCPATITPRGPAAIPMVSDSDTLPLGRGLFEYDPSTDALTPIYSGSYFLPAGQAVRMRFAAEPEVGALVDPDAATVGEKVRAAWLEVGIDLAEANEDGNGGNGLPPQVRVVSLKCDAAWQYSTAGGDPTYDPVAIEADEWENVSATQIIMYPSVFELWLFSAEGGWLEYQLSTI